MRSKSASFSYLVTALVGLGLTIFAGCATSNTAYVPPSDMGSYAKADEPSELAAATLQESLFKEDQAILANADLERILSSKILIPDGAKLAVIRFGQMPYWWGWSDDFVRTNRQIDDDFLATLRTSGRLRQVAYLPSLVTPRQMTIPHLRAAAARCQADLMLIYRTSKQNYRRYKAFSPDEVRAYCTVEAILVDTRTGIIPFSTVVTKDYYAKRVKEDTNFAETVAKAEQQAIGQAWVDLARETTLFLASPETSATTQRVAR